MGNQFSSKASVYAGQHSTVKCGQTSEPQVHFKPAAPLFKWSRTVHTLDHEVTVIIMKLNSLSAYEITAPIKLMDLYLYWHVSQS
jgi:hypothetical protein